MIDIVPTNAKKFTSAIAGISEAAGLIQTSGVAFNEIFPTIRKLMEVLEDLGKLQTRFNVVPSGRGRAIRMEGTTGLSLEEIAQLEIEAGVSTPTIPTVVQALAPSNSEASSVPATPASTDPLAIP